MAGMDALELSPNDYASNDTTFTIEGYSDHMEDIEEKYPEEDFRTETERRMEGAFDPENQEEANLNFPTEGESELGLAPEDFGVDPNPVESPIQGNPYAPSEGQPTAVNPWNTSRPLVHADGTPISANKIKQLNLDKNGGQLHEREAELAGWIKDPNLDNTLKAFKEINGDPTLTEIFDTNGDGRFSFSDMFDTSRMNGGDGLSDQEDIELTEKWLNSITSKDLRSRLGGLANMILPNKTKVIMDRRRINLTENPEDLSHWETKFPNLMGGVLEWGKATLSLPEQIGSFVTGGDFGGHDAKLDDWVFNTKSEDSVAWLIDNPTRRKWGDGVAYELGYWVPEAFMITSALSKTSKVLNAASKTLPAGKRLALATSRLIDPNVTAKALVRGKGLGATKWVKPVGSKWSVPYITASLKNIATTATKAGFIETFKGTMQRDMTENGMGTLKQDGFASAILRANADSEIWGRAAQWGIENPLGKRYTYWMDEAIQDSIGAGGLFSIFSFGKRGLGGTYRFGQKVLDNLKISKGMSWSTWKHADQRNAKYMWEVRQQKGIDRAEAATEELSLYEDGASNAYYREGSSASGASTYGPMKNGSNDVAQGTIATRHGPRQILNDADEIAEQVIKKPGSTDALLSPLQLRKAANNGIGFKQLDLFARQFVEDIGLGKQLRSLNPADRTLGTYNRGSLIRTQEILGRDAGSLSPREYWGDALVDAEIPIGNYNELDEVKKFVAMNIQANDAINSSLLSQLRDIAAVSGDLLGKSDIFSIGGPMQRVADNLVAGLNNVKKTRLTWEMVAQRLETTGGEITEDVAREVTDLVKTRGTSLHQETQDGVKLMMQMLKDNDAPELVEGILDVFKVSNDIHNWTDFDAWMRQKISGGEFKGKVKTGALIRELQGVMVNSILSGPKTPMRAIMGTTANAYLNAINEAGGAFIRSPFTKDVASRKVSLAKLKGMFELIPEGWHVFRENWNAKFDADFADIRTRYSEAPTRADQNWELFSQWTEKNGTVGDKAALGITNIARTLNNNKLLSWSPRALAATDDTFKWLLARVRSKEIGMRQAMEAAGEDWQKLSPELMKQAEEIHYNHLLDADGNLNLANDSWLNKQFKEITLTSELEGFSKKLDGLLNETPLLKPFYLFARTGINGLNLSFKNTPLLGALHKESIAILRHTGDDFTPLMRYGIENANDLANARNLFAGRQAVGGAVVMGMGGMYAAGQLTGNGPADRQLKQSWINAGWKPNHIYIGDVGFDYSALEPYNVIFSSIADIGDNLELMGNEWAEKRLQAVGYVVGRGLTSKTYMSGLDQLMQIMQMKPGAFDKAAANILNNSIPLAGARNEFGKWINPHMKELNSDMWTSIRNRNQLTEYMAGGNKLPTKYDMLNGTPIKNWNIIGRSFNAVSPVQLDIRRNSPGRRLLRDSNYDLKSTTYAYGGYSFVKHPIVRSHFQNAIGNVPIKMFGKTFKNVEEALTYASSRPDVKRSLKEMQANVNNPSAWDIDPTTYPHNTIIDRIMSQARSKAWALINKPDHPGYSKVLELKAEKDGKDRRTRNNRKEILELSFPQIKPPRDY